MTHWRQLMDQEYVGAWDLPAGKDVPVIIRKVESVKLEARGDDDRRKKDEMKVLLHFQGKEKPMVANATNCKTIARLYGNDTRKWVGQGIYLYATTTRAFGETHDCIRIRPKRAPSGGGERRGSEAATQTKEERDAAFRAPEVQAEIDREKAGRVPGEDDE